jgi:hypothetical protein
MGRARAHDGSKEVVQSRMEASSVDSSLLWGSLQAGKSTADAHVDQTEIHKPYFPWTRTGF